MTDYTELVKALRSASTVSTAWEKLMHDAAAAIEALEARLGEVENSVERWKDMYLTKHEPKRGEMRCRECKWYQEGYDIDGKWFSRCNGSVRTYGQTTPDWYCADGEREVQE